jgi:catechol 2,3-dioxygenase-like lactoylglutathione lyase family enzyme
MLGPVIHNITTEFPVRLILTLLAVLLAPVSVLADGHDSGPGETEPGYASLIRTTIICRLADLEPSKVFWGDVLGFTYRGDPQARTGAASPFGWTEDSVTYYTQFDSTDGAMLGLLMIEETPGYPEVTHPATGGAHNTAVLVHRAKNLEDVYNRAVAAGVEILKPYGLSGTGRSMQILLRAPTGQLVEIYELLPQDD